tara:strand:+ start:3025 stop:3933 length:909 start_codon:yes stop_codon:yes gene_type:complete
MAFGTVTGGRTEAGPPPSSEDCCLLINSVTANLNVETLHDVPIRTAERKYRVYGTVTAKAEKRCIPKVIPEPNEFAGPAVLQGPHWSCGNFKIPLTCAGGRWPKPKRPDPFKPGEERPKPENEVDFGFEFNCKPIPGLPTPPSLKMCSVEWESCSEPCSSDPANCYCNVEQTTSVDFEIDFLNIAGDLAGIIRAARSLIPGIGSSDAVSVAGLVDDLGGCAVKFFKELKDKMPKGVCGKKVNCECQKEGEDRSFALPDKKPKFDPLSFGPSWLGNLVDAGGATDAETNKPCDCESNFKPKGW